MSPSVEGTAFEPVQTSTAAVARWPGGQGGQLPPQLALKRGRQNDDGGAPAAKQITRNVFNYDGLFM